MKTLKMERIHKLDAEHGAEIRDLVRHLRLSTILHEDNRELFSEIAEKLGIGIDEFSSYVWFQAYVKELRESFDYVTSPSVVAQQLGVTFLELDAYICGRDTVMTAEEYRDYMEDLQQDAGDILQGD